MKHKYTAIMKTDAYFDLCKDWEYEIKDVRYYSNHNLRIMINGSPRRYLASDFTIFKDGEPITAKEAYNAFKFRNAMKKVGLEQ